MPDRCCWWRWRSAPLYGGLGPGVLALLLAGLLSRDPGVLLAAAALVAVCARFRRAPPRREPADSSGPEPASDPAINLLEQPAAVSSAFASDTSRSAPPFIEVTTEATWRFHHEKPLDITRYRLEDAESQEIDRYGNAKYFVNNLVGIFERGQLVGAWGTQRDVTEGKSSAEAQEYRSRIHSAKSSSQ
jgi:hypothetical protein